MHPYHRYEANMPPTQLPPTVSGGVLMVESGGISYLRPLQRILPSMADWHIAAKIRDGGCCIAISTGNNTQNKTPKRYNNQIGWRGSRLVGYAIQKNGWINVIGGGIGDLASNIAYLGLVSLQNNIQSAIFCRIFRGCMLRWKHNSIKRIVPLYYLFLFEFNGKI